MKKNVILLGLLVLGIGFATSSCSDDDEEKKTEITEEEARDLDYTEANAKAWGNYAKNVASLLQTDAATLNSKWQNGYGAAFKAHNGSSTEYKSAEDCIEQIIDGCIDIANEVGTAKIGEPYDLLVSGETTQALYAVESWYSWHSRDDYKNNILSIANSLAGKNIGYDANPSRISANQASSNSVMGVCLVSNALSATAVDVWTKVGAAWNAIDNIPQPFRNNISSKETSIAMDACADLVKALEELKGKIGADESIEWQAVVDQFVDNVALPTYADLATANANLYKAVSTLQANPTNANFETACNAWLNARRPWETSEAFLFGPVAELGLDPNMDSWPLDQVGIANLMKSENWKEFEWSGDYDEDNEAIEAAQSLRGFHTLEFLLFKDGKPRTIK